MTQPPVAEDLVVAAARGEVVVNHLLDRLVRRQILIDTKHKLAS